MSEREPDQQPDGENEDETTGNVVEEIENDPSTAGPPNEPGEELRGG